MHRYLVAVSLVCVMGTASAQGIDACRRAAGEDTGDTPRSGLVEQALQHARVSHDALRIPVSGPCELLADRRKTRSADHRGDAAAGRKRDPDYYRFDMSQHGKQMSAEDFDRWMKARGIRVAKGPQPAAKPVARAERKRRR